MKTWAMFSGFLTAMRQEVTRANKGWALDTVILYNKVLKQTKEEITASPTVSQKHGNTINTQINFLTSTLDSLIRNKKKTIHVYCFIDCLLF